MAATYRVDGMTCGGCVRAVTNAITGMDPAAKVDVDLREKLVTVDGSLSDDQVRQAVEDAGFDFAGRR